jgi:succinoglycan biosynthesis protein ExoO
VSVDYAARAKAPVDVSVIIAAWKAADFIERAIASALTSTDVSIEVIAVDDASPDPTFSVLRELADRDPRVVARQLPTNSGPSAARNLGIELARGRYVAVLDADDTMEPDRLAKLAALADRSGADIVVDNMIEVDEAGQRLGDQPFLKSSSFNSARDIDLVTWVRFNNPMVGGDTLGYLKPLIRKQKLIDTGISYDETLRNSEDYYLIAHLLAAGARMTYSPDADYRYTRSAGSTSHRLQPAQTRAWLDAEKRFLSQHDAVFSGEERALLKRRSRTLSNVNQLVAIIDALKAKKIAASARLVASDLRGGAYAAGVLAKIAMNKAFRRKAV